MRAHTLILACTVLISAPLLAASPIDGTWKTDPSKIDFAKRPQTIAISGGTYKCETCTPPWSVAADGKFHPTPGRPYADEVAVTLIDATTAKVAQRQKGKDIGESVNRLSADGNTLMRDWKSVGANGSISTGTDTLARTAPTPAGAHALAGSWQMTKTESSSQGVFEQTFKMHGDMLHLSTPDGESYQAKLGGPAVPIKGDRAGTMVKVAKVGERGFTETGIRDGKPVYVMTLTVAADGKSVDVANENKLTNSTTKFVAYKQ